jgi:hypothetical protein
VAKTTLKGKRAVGIKTFLIMPPRSIMADAPLIIPSEKTSHGKMPVSKYGKKGISKLPAGIRILKNFEKTIQ